MSIEICDNCNGKTDTDYEEMTDGVCEGCIDFAEEWGDTTPDRI